MKQTCINTLKNLTKTENTKSTTCLPIDDFETFLEYIEKGFDESESEEIEVIGYKIKISNYKLVTAIKMIPENLRIALVLNIVAEISMNDIAKILGVTERTVKNYKSNAIEKIRGYMDSYAE